MSPSERIIFCIGITALGCTVPLLSMANKANEQWNVRQDLNQNQQQSEISSQTALSRAKYCLQLDLQTPITSNSIVTYYRSKRLLPAGQIICDQYGNTALVDGAGRAIDIHSAPAEKINKILEERHEKNE